VIRVPRAVAEEIRREGERTYPEECCGALLGRAENGSKSVLLARPFPNGHPGERARRYLVGPEDYREAEAWARSRGLDVVGIYHSHPDHPARPSEVDREQAWPWFSYLILSVERGIPSSMTSWVLADDRGHFDPEELQCL
jgi:proteasome lid subunit RPN8/RPN11